MDGNLAPEQHRGDRVARIRILVRGTVQGVGFRPFVYRLAQESGVSGWVRNSSRGVDVEIEGEAARLSVFRARLQSEKPPLATIDAIEHVATEPHGDNGFAIVSSNGDGAALIPILPEVATCDACRSEAFDPGDRRHRYPFSSCTHCGPRYSIVETLPYDRSRTSMKSFPLCDRCQAEYDDPLDRRFHAQANACPECGPQLELLDRRGACVAARDEALRRAARAIVAGEIVAVKGLCGFHLMTSAASHEAVERLRRRKHRDEKPFALMMSSIDSVRQQCHATSVELELLSSPAAPIVLVRRGPQSDIAPGVAPGNNPYLGVMLAYTPMHHLLMGDIGGPVVATSANRSDEPICSKNDETIERMRDIADLFLVHDRGIVNPLDDSVTSVIAGRPVVLRRARGYAPAPVVVDNDRDIGVFAVGAHLCNTVAISVGRQCFISPHIGDLGSLQSYQHYTRVIGGLQRVYDHKPERIACDLHPDYRSTRYAESLGLPLIRVQHHYAHALACMVDNKIDAPVMGVCWDGTGDGGDGTVWGGEFLRIHGDGFDRAAHLRTFSLPGGEVSVREARRAAFGALYETFGRDALAMADLEPLRDFTTGELALLGSMIDKRIHSPLTSSAGRLFDAVSSLLGLVQRSSFGGQAAMTLEYAADGQVTDRVYPFDVSDDISPRVVDWRPALRAVVADVRAGVDRAEIAATFHNTLAGMILCVCGILGEKRVVLSGGCFQNRYLTERVLYLMKRDGFDVYWHRDVPPNDGGIALGQIAAAMREKKGS